MSLPLYLRGCGFPRQLMFFVFRVEGSEREGFLQVLLAPQTKLRGRGRSVRGEEYVNMWFYLVGSQNQRQLIIRDIQLSTPALLIGPLNKQERVCFCHQSYFTCGWMSGSSVGVAAIPCPSVSD